MFEHMNYKYNVDLKESKSEQAIEKMNEQANDLINRRQIEKKTDVFNCYNQYILGKIGSKYIYLLIYTLDNICFCKTLRLSD